MCSIEDYILFCFHSLHRWATLILGRNKVNEKGEERNSGDPNPIRLWDNSGHSSLFQPGEEGDFWPSPPTLVTLSKDGNK